MKQTNFNARDKIKHFKNVLDFYSADVVGTNRYNPLSSDI